MYVDLYVAAILPAQRVVCMSSPIHLLHCYGLFFFFLFQFFAVGIYFLWLVQSVKLQSFFFSFHSFKKENYLGSKLPHLQPPCTFD